MKPIKVAIIGYGKIAEDQHAPSIAGNSRFELVATSSRSGQGVAQSFKDWRELVDWAKGELAAFDGAGDGNEQRKPAPQTQASFDDQWQRPRAPRPV